MTTVSQLNIRQPSARQAPTKPSAEQTAKSLARLALPKDALPRHIAIIMDGNGRWARSRNQPRIFGHEHGSRTVRNIVTECARLELEVLTLYGFSTENWNRPADEIEFLMELFKQYLIAERPEMMDNNIRYMHIGRREGLPQTVLDELDETIRITASNTGLKLAVAINYGSRAEIVDAVRILADKVKAGQFEPDEIDEETIAQHLYTTGLPDPDLLIRTAGEMRISNYLLWQISYAELYVTEAYWPQFDIDQLHLAIREFANRQRRFGGVPD